MAGFPPCPPHSRRPSHFICVSWPGTPRPLTIWRTPIWKCSSSGWAKPTRRVPEDIRIEAAEDAILALIRKPESYSPERQTLEVYLRMSARGDLRNLLAKERRVTQRPNAVDRRRTFAGRREVSGTERRPVAAASPRRGKAEHRRGRAGFRAARAVRNGPSALELILQRNAGPPCTPNCMDCWTCLRRSSGREVKRHKDRLKNVLKRAGRKP